MNWWLITDTHFSHDKMHKLCGRPVGFEEKILKNLKVYVKPGDVLIHLGDFCIGNDHENQVIFMNTLKAIEQKNPKPELRVKRWLVKGNHDRKSTTWYLSHGWDFVADMVRLDMYGKNIIFTHKPVDWVRGAGQNFLNIHGHEHNTRHHTQKCDDRFHLLVHMEHEYRPVKLEKLVMAHDQVDWTQVTQGTPTDTTLTPGDLASL